MCLVADKLHQVGCLLIILFGLFALSACDSAEERVESHYKRGLELVEQGEHLKASLEFRNALKLNDKHTSALHSLAKTEQQLGRLRQAAGIYLRVVEADPQHVDARVALANILLLAGQLDEALKFANQAHGLASTNPTVLVLKAAVALRLGNKGEAIRFADAALKVEPKNIDALLVRAAERLSSEDPKGALVYLDKGEETDERNIGLQFFKIRTLASLQNREGVERVLLKLIKFYPDNAGFRYGLVRWYLSEKRIDAAEKALRQFAKDYPENTQAGLALVTFLARQRGVDAAKTELASRIKAGGDSFAYELALAELTFSGGNDEDAYILLGKVIAEKGASSEGARAKVLLARMKAGRNELTEAEALATEVLAVDEKNADALAVRSSIRVANKQYSEAIEDLLAALNEEPDSTRVLQLLARAYELNGSTELAEEQLSKAVRLDGFKPGVGLNYVQFLLRYGKAEQAERVLTEVRAVAPANKQVLTLLSRLRLSRQDWLGSQEIAEELRKLDDTADQADRIQAEVLAGQQKYDESNELLKTSMSDVTSDTAPLARYVRNLVQGGKTEQAVAFLTEVLTSNPDNLRARVLLGSVHEVGGKLDLAETAFKTAVEHDTDGVTGLNALARFYVRRTQLEAAEATIRKALARQGNNLSMRLLLALVLERTEQYKAAISEYEIMFEASPQSTIIANNLASMLADYGGSPEQIEQAHAIAVRFRGSDIPQFLDTLGWINYLRKDYEQAAKQLKTAAEALQNVGLVQYHLGMTYKALGRKSLAIERLESAIKLSEGQLFAQLEEAKAVLTQLRDEPATQD